MTNYQNKLRLTFQNAYEVCCLYTFTRKLKNGRLVYIHCGNYDNQVIARAYFEVTDIKPEYTHRYILNASDSTLTVYSTSINALLITLNKVLAEDFKCQV